MIDELPDDLPPFAETLMHPSELPYWRLALVDGSSDPKVVYDRNDGAYAEFLYEWLGDGRCKLVEVWLRSAQDEDIHAVRLHTGASHQEYLEWFDSTRPTTKPAREDLLLNS